jgi:hypothetical protein
LPFTDWPAGKNDAREGRVPDSGVGRGGRSEVPATAAPMIVGLLRESTKREHHDGRDGEDDG